MSAERNFREIIGPRKLLSEIELAMYLDFPAQSIDALFDLRPTALATLANDEAGVIRVPDDIAMFGSRDFDIALNTLLNFVPIDMYLEICMDLRTIGWVPKFPKDVSP